MKKITHEQARKEINDIESFIGYKGDGFTTVLKNYISQPTKKTSADVFYRLDKWVDDYLQFKEEQNKY